MKLPYEQLIADILTAQGKTIAIAESCTGGLVSAMLTDIPGSSNYIDVNFVTYSYDAKHKYLGVKHETLDVYGAVSPQVAVEMAEGLIKNTNADYALSTTGIAGPSGGSDKKPVGLIYIGAASRSKSVAFKHNANPVLERTLIKSDFAQHALKAFYEFLKESSK